jgi:hypothetical protein
MKRPAQEILTGKRWWLALMACLAPVIPAATIAQTDEIQVYDAEIAEPGIFNLMVRTNFTPIGRTTPAFRARLWPMIR